MAGFDDRRDAFEKKFAHDEELRFKAVAPRHKLFGLLGAPHPGKSGSDAEAYSRAVILADFQEAGDGDVIRKVRQDFEAAGKTVSDAEVAGVLAGFMNEAVDQIKAGQ